MSADVQGWFYDPTTNNGWLLMGDESKLRTTKPFRQQGGRG
jgi:hypothetical protein